MSEPKKEDDPLEGLDDHLQDPAEGARKAGEDVPEDADKVEETDDGENVNKEEETESETDEEYTLEQRHDYLKKEVGRQANEIGDLTRKLEEATPAPKPAEPTVNPLQEKLEKAKKLYGPEIVDLIVEVAQAETAPVQQAQGLQTLRDRYSDFDEVRADMDAILKKSPALSAAWQQDITVLDTVYTAAKAKRGELTKSESTQKDEARRNKVGKAKDAAFVEKPSVKADTPKKVTQKEQDDGFVDHIINLPLNA